jgi:salicylate hydroxylase
VFADTLDAVMERMCRSRFKTEANMQVRHVSIIGAGLGGLCLAQGLRRAGIPFDVFERDPAPDSRPQGYRIRIDADGQAALSQTLSREAYARFEHTCSAPAGVRFIDGQLLPIAGRPARTWRSEEVSSGASAPGGDLCAHRQTLREILMDGIADRIHFGKGFRRFERIEDGARVHLDDGSSVVSSLLVGADGVNSAVREQLAPGARPLDTGAMCIYGKTPATPAVLDALGDTLGTHTCVVFSDGFATVLDPMRFRDRLSVTASRAAGSVRLSPVDDYFYWAFIGPRARLGVDAAEAPDARALSATVDALVRAWHPRLRALFDHGDRGGLAMLPVRSAPAPVASWRERAVTLLGDAIHAMSPAAGVGANTALRDAEALASELAAAFTSAAQCASWDLSPGGVSLQAAVARYEYAMRERANVALRASEDGSRRLFERSSTAC